MFEVIVADPPWEFNDRLRMSSVKRGAESQYPVMSLEILCGLPIPLIADQTGCLLALWVPSSMLDTGLKVMGNWGFTLKQTYVWVKTTYRVNDPENRDTLAFGMGRLFRQAHEIALIGINNPGIYSKLVNRSQRSLCIEPNVRHSTKPENLQDSLDLMFPHTKKLEIFARRKRDGWLCLGNELSGKKIQDEIIEVFQGQRNYE